MCLKARGSASFVAPISWLAADASIGKCTATINSSMVEQGSLSGTWHPAAWRQALRPHDRDRMEAHAHAFYMGHADVSFLILGNGWPMTILSLVAGFILLLVGGETVVRGSVALARRFAVPPLVIGLTVVGFGTSLPELIVSINAALTGAPGIAVGNVIGSNVANMMLILGLAALIFPFAANPDAVRRDSLVMAAFTAVFIIVALGGSAGAGEGALMIGALVAYIGFCLWQGAGADGVSQRRQEEAESMGALPTRLWLMSLFVAGGLLALAAGAELLVNAATVLARDAGVADEVIGLTLVAVGTSLPEIATAVVAAWRRQADICLGNVIGSNIFNLFGILGATALVVPVPFSMKIVDFDLWVLGGMTLILVRLLLLGRPLRRRIGVLLLIVYATYILFQFP